MWLTGPSAPRHVGSSQTRARTRVPCIGRLSTTAPPGKPSIFLFIVLALSCRMDEGLWSYDHKLPKLVSICLNCLGSPNASGALGALAGPEVGLVEFCNLCVHRHQIMPSSGVSLLRSLDLVESDLFPHLVLRKEVLSCASKVVLSF